MVQFKLKLTNGKCQLGMQTNPVLLDFKLDTINT